MLRFRCVFSIVFFTFSLTQVDLLENGLARTPPMGWMSWGYYMCGTKCEHDTDKCLNEKLIMAVADSFFTEGYQEAGYEYIIIDDCWAEMSRDNLGRLVPDKKRFPRGMKFLSDYIHSKGLKFGMYTNIADVTCMLYPGSKDHFNIDAKSFASWGVDYLKVDGCFVSEDYLNSAYKMLGYHLNMTGRPMVYSCSWPYYIEFIHNHKIGIVKVNIYTQRHINLDCLDFELLEVERCESCERPDLQKVSKYCNMWRNYHDVVMSWNMLVSIIIYYETSYKKLAPYHGPGSWNDPDMLLHGTGALPDSQIRVQTALYAMWSAPLLLSCDMTKVNAYEKQLLLNLDLIAIGQDPLGIMAKPYKLPNHVTLWVKPHQPRKGDAYPTHSFAFVNLEIKTVKVTFFPHKYGLNNTDPYTVLDVFSSTYIRNISITQTMDVIVPGHDVILYTLYPL